MAIADKFSAITFDIEGGDFSYYSALCTFEVVLNRFGLKSPSLDRLGRVITAADTNPLETVPQTAGLLAMSVGLSKMYRDDHSQLASGMIVCDALYLWARDGFNETHDWPK